MDVGQPLVVDVVTPRPAILELRAGSEAVGRGVKVSALVEWRVSGYEVDCAAVKAPQKVKVVAVI